MAITLEEVQGVSQPASQTRALTFENTWVPALNDLVVLWAAADQTITNITVPAGWGNVLGGSNFVASDANSLCCLWHLVTAGEVSAVTRTYTLSFLLSASIAGATAGIVLRGVDTTNPVDDANSAFDSGNSATPHVLAGLTGANLSNNSMVFSGLLPDGAEQYATPPTGWTSRHQFAALSVSTGRYLNVLSRDALTTAGVDVSAANITPDTAGNEYVSITAAFAEATAAATLYPPVKRPNYGSLIQV